MDHLPRLLGSNGPWHNIPFYGRFDYDGLGIRGFPSRRGFKLENPGGIYTNDKYSAFFQAWLYFGTLADVFGAYDIPVLTDDFYHEANGRLHLKSDRLEDYIAAWIVQASREDGAVLEKDKYRYRARAVGENFGTQLGKFVGKAIVKAKYGNIDYGSTHAEANAGEAVPGQIIQGGREKTTARAFKIFKTLETVSTTLHSYGQGSSSIEDAIWDSVLILCSTLESAAYSIYRAFEFDFKFRHLFHILPARLRGPAFDEMGWCPREKKIIYDLVEGDQCVLSLCAQLDRRQDRELHSKCDQKMCHGYQITDKAEYRTKHVTSNCPCEFIGLGKCEIIGSSPSNDSFICRVVNRESSLPRKLRPAPMVTYTNGGLQIVDVSLVGAEAVRLTNLPVSKQYVAISHVWADGLGNRDANDLPRCQLERLQKLVNEMFPPKEWPVPFWIDTLCVPLHDSSRKRSLEHMEWIYKSASKVLVLDRRLLDVSANGMSAEEVGLRIMCSAWARRLWTLQEGSFQSRVYYRFKDILYSYDNLNKEVVNKHAFPSRRRNVPPEHFLHRILDEPPNCQTFISPLQKNAHRALNCVWLRVSSFFKEMNITYSQPDPKWLPGAQLNPWIQITVPRAIRTMMSRTTSRLEDEPLVFSSLTNWWSGSGAALVHTQPSERYRKFFTSFGFVPSQLIFLNQKRYEEDGSRWIPTSLLSQASPNCAPLAFEHSILDQEWSQPTRHGLGGDYPGWHLLTMATEPLPEQFQVSLGPDAVYTAKVYVAGEDEQRSPPQTQASIASTTNLAIVVHHTIRTRPLKCAAVLVSIRRGSGDAVTVPSVTAAALRSRTARPAVGGSTGMIAKFQTALKNIWTEYQDDRRIVARHEALVDLTYLTREELEFEQHLHHRTSASLPWIQADRINYCTDDKGNNRWRIG